MALGVGCCIATIALLLPFASFWGPFGALALRIGWWTIPFLLLLGAALLAWEVALYLHAEWRLRR